MNFENGWEKFEGGPEVAKQNRLHVTINERCNIFLNSNAHRLLGRPAAVAIYYNREKDVIALEPADVRLPETFPVIERLSGWLIRARPFCRHFGIDPSTTENFTHPEIDTTGVLLLDLSNTVTVKRSTRKYQRKPLPNRTDLRISGD